MTTTIFLEVQGDLGAIGVKTVTDGKAHRRVIHPGDDLSGESQEVVDLAGKTWTPEIVSAWEAHLEAIKLPPMKEPPVPEAVKLRGEFEKLKGALIAKGIVTDEETKVEAVTVKP